MILVFGLNQLGAQFLRELHVAAAALSLIYRCSVIHVRRVANLLALDLLLTEEY